MSGATSGLGAALADEFDRLGVRVTGCGTRPTGRYERVDVTIAAQVRRWADRSADGGPFHLVVASAGRAMTTGPAARMSDVDFTDLLRVNVVGVAAMFAAFTPYAADDCVFVAMSSRWGRSAPRPGQAAYCASKFAVEGLVLAWRHEVGPGQRVYAVDPGAGIDTPMMRRMTPPGTWHRPAVDRRQWAARAAPFLRDLVGAAHGPSHLRVPG